MRIALNGACTGLVLALGASIALPATIRAQTPDTVSATIDARNRSEPVTRHAYGMFIEPIGGLVARSLWAEMLDDRKFYYPVVTAAKDVPPPPNPEGRPGVTYRKWRPIGNDGAVEMDTSDPFVGK